MRASDLCMRKTRISGMRELCGLWSCVENHFTAISGPWNSSCGAQEGGHVGLSVESAMTRDNRAISVRAP